MKCYPIANCMCFIKQYFWFPGVRGYDVEVLQTVGTKESSAN